MKLKRIFGIIIALAAFTALCLVPSASSQMNSGMGRAHRIYNPATETTVKGTVEAVRKVWGHRHWSGTHLTLKTESGTYDVHLGPSSFLKKKNFTFAKGDEIEVTGSKVMYRHRDAIVAREIVKDGETLTLRDAQGYPEWAGSGRGRGMQ